MATSWCNHEQLKLLGAVGNTIARFEARHWNESQAAATNSLSETTLKPRRRNSGSTPAST